MSTKTEGNYKEALVQDNNAPDNRKPAVTIDRSKKSKGAFRTISEVAEELDVQQHVLRFWETKFSQIRPLKRGGGRRYYRPEDLELLKRIHELLYTEGYTIKGVQKLFRQNGKNSVLDGEVGGTSSITADTKIETPIPEMPLESDNKSEVGKNLSNFQKQTLEIMLQELKELRVIVAELK